MVSFISLADRVISLGLKVRPVWLRKRLFSLLFSLYVYVSRLKAVVFQFRLPVCVVSGVEKTSGEKIQFLFVGHGRFPLFLIELLFASEPHVEKVGMVFVWRLHKLDRFFPSDLDAILVSCDRFYQRWLQKAGLFVFPQMVDMVLDVSDPFDVFYKGLSNSAKADIRKVRKQGYSYEVFSDLDRLRFFYDGMYLPLIESRFADKPLYKAPFTLYKLLHMMGYRLLLVKDASGDFISGSYFYVKDDEVFSRYSGVMNGDIGLIRTGAESAYYCFLIDWAKKNGINKVNFGHSRSFRNDGVFRYKQKWGTMMRRSAGTHMADIFGVKVVKEKSLVNDFIIKNPFFGVDRNDDFVEYPIDKLD